MTTIGTTLRRRARAAITLAAAAALVGLLPTSSQANVNRYTVQPNSPKPTVCNNSGTIPASTWIQNKVCGYWVGTAMASSSFDVHQTAASNYHYGRSLGGNNICGWIPPGALGSSPTASVAESCSDATKDNISHRRTIGYNFNAAARGNGRHRNHGQPSLHGVLQLLHDQCIQRRFTARRGRQFRVHRDVSLHDERVQPRDRRPRQRDRLDLPEPLVRHRLARHHLLQRQRLIRRTRLPGA
ncbi:hypothetical protein ACFQ51_40110 [Streptomyces kaempferi]